MRPWMRVFPKRVRHLLICRWKYGWNNYCVGHGPNLEKRYGISTLYDGWQRVPKRPRPWMRPLPKRVRHLIICRWKGRYRNYCVGHGPDKVRYLKATVSG